MASAEEETETMTSCIICDKRLEIEKKSNPIVKNPTLDGLITILNVAQLKDDVFRKFSPHKEDILAGRLKVPYHKACRKIYTVNIKTVQSAATASKTNSSESALLTRLCFNIQRDCFICGKNNERP